MFFGIYKCKDQFWIEPRTGMDPGPSSSNNKFVESERKCLSEFRIKIFVYSVKREELHAHRCKKYPRTCPSIGTKSNEFFFFYCCISSTFSFLLFILRVIYYGFTPLPPSTCGSGIGSPFFLFPLPLLEPSILSCKAACSLFRHHLHINTTRELVGQHLSGGNSTSRYLFSLILIIYLIFSHPLCCKVCPRRYFKRLMSLLATSDRCSEVVVVLGHGYILHRYSLPLFGV